MTRDQIIYQRRLRVLAHAEESGNVAETCRIFGVSRTRFYEWKGVAERYGVEALMPKARRRPQLANATPTHVLEALLTLAVLQPTLGCRQLADRLADRGFVVSKTTGGVSDGLCKGFGSSHLNGEQTDVHDQGEPGS